MRVARLGDLAPARFTLPEDPIVMGMESKPVQTGNPLLYELSKGCIEGLPCRARLQGLGEFEIPYVGVTVPGSQWMYLVGAGLLAGLWFMGRGGKK